MSRSENTPTQGSRPARPQSISYADLMKPDEDWRLLPDAAERRKIQNRLAQRAYRRNMRDRTKEVERLKKQLEKLQHGNNPEAASTSTDDESEKVSQPSKANRRSLNLSECSQTSSNLSTPPLSAGSQWMNDYLPVWQDSDSISGLGLSSDGEQSHGFGGPGQEYYAGNNNTSLTSPQIQAFRDRAASIAHFNVTSSHKHIGHHRSQSNPSWLSSVGSRGASSPWKSHNHDNTDGMQIANYAPNMSPMILDSLDYHDTSLPGNLNLYTNPEALSLQKPANLFPLEDDATPTRAYPTPPDSEESTYSWSNLNGKSLSRTQTRSPSSMSATLSSSGTELNGADTNSPLLHLAVVGGHIDTLRLLLQRNGYSINARDNAGYTALQRAVMNGRNDMVMLLLEHGADSATQLSLKIES